MSKYMFLHPGGGRGTQKSVFSSVEPQKVVWAISFDKKLSCFEAKGRGAPLKTNLELNIKCITFYCLNISLSINQSILIVGKGNTYYEYD